MEILNENEIKVLKSLIPSSKGNGHDFGWTDEHKDCGFNKHQMAGYFSQLSQKAYIEIEDLSEDSGTESNGCQFTFTLKAEKFLEEIGIEIYVDSNH